MGPKVKVVLLLHSQITSAMSIPVECSDHGLVVHLRRTEVLKAGPRRLTKTFCHSWKMEKMILGTCKEKR